ncbi:iclR helix-turn-helix domain protein [Asticcacaulis biprosthecium C19]|uniref:IclR helix-turn-helix domain protein n=1 Tax=Asticcacaulis biprosthecium C19 TaxID=715226 RepID=F4QTE6_9CAUL|nr:IclR family transcriptional regulator [Asticcacaulis biprosthecium]EGF90016.1 iclR helix-turn-helix domain protein [Asticcacaulis biprosthecium C19]
MASSSQIPDDTATKAPVYSAPALEKGFTILELLSEFPRGLTITEMAGKLGFSVSEIFRVIMVMERLAWLRRHPGDRFRVTLRLLEMGFKATPVDDLVETAAPFMRDLANRIEQSCHLVVRNAERGMIVHRQQTPGPTVFAVRVGAEIVLETSCSGHVLLAFDAVNDGRAVPPLSLDSALETTLRKVRARGYEMMKSARTVGVTDISYPIFGGNGVAVAALTVPFLQLIDGTQKVERDDARVVLQETCRQISEELGAIRS